MSLKFHLLTVEGATTVSLMFLVWSVGVLRVKLQSPLNIQPLVKLMKARYNCWESLHLTQICLNRECLHSNLVKNLIKENLRVVKMLLKPCMIHRFFPKLLINAVITPLLKKIYVDVRNNSNYKKIMISSTLLKLLGYCKLHSFTEYGIPSPL